MDYAIFSHHHKNFFLISAALAKCELYKLENQALLRQFILCFIFFGSEKISRFTKYF